METTGESTTDLHPYWHVWQLVHSALNSDRPAAAAAAFHRASALMPTVIPAAEQDPGSMPQEFRQLRDDPVSDYDRAQGITSYFAYPLTDQRAFAFAAGLADHGSLKILDSFCGRFGSEEQKPCSADYLRIVAKVHEVVASNAVTDIKDVRKVFSPEDRVRLRSVWRAMRDAKILIVETRGTNIFFHRDASAPVPVPAKPDAFRKGKPAAEARLISRPAHTQPPVTDLPNGSESPLDRWPVGTPTETPLPTGSRRTRKSRAVSAGDKVWLQTGYGKRADGWHYVPTEVIEQDGARGLSKDLDYGMLRSNPQGDCIVSQRDVDFRIYTPDAELVMALNLASTPEVRETIRQFGEKGLQPSSAVRSVHASLATGLLAVNVIDRVFVYSFSGDVVAAFRLEEIVKEEERFGPLIVTASPREDWAYFVQLARDGEGLYVGAHTGLLLHLSFSGDLIQSWSLNAAPLVLRETATGIAGLTGTNFFQAGHGGPVRYTATDYRALSQVVGNYVVLDTRKTSGVFDLDSFEGQKVELRKPLTAAYLANGKLVMETAASLYTF